MNTYFEVSPPLFMSVNEESKDTHPKVTFTNRLTQQNRLSNRSISATEPFRFGTAQLLGNIGNVGRYAANGNSCPMRELCIAPERQNWNRLQVANSAKPTRSAC